MGFHPQLLTPPECHLVLIPAFGQVRSPESPSSAVPVHLCIADGSTCTMSEWITWSPCSISCGTGMRSRERYVKQFPEDGSVCTLPTEETEKCTVNEECCEWGPGREGQARGSQGHRCDPVPLPSSQQLPDDRVGRVGRVQCHLWDGHEEAAPHGQDEPGGRFHVQGGDVSGREVHDARVP